MPGTEGTKHLPSARLVALLEEAPRVVAASAKATISPREFTGIAEAMEPEKVEAWVAELVKRGHGSPLEHSLYIFEVVCSRVCSHQLVRHRLASYSQLSQRHSDKFLRSMAEAAARAAGLAPCCSFECYAEGARKAAERAGFEELLEIAGEAFIVPPEVVSRRDDGFLRELLRSASAYYLALAAGVPYEDARYLLPQAVKTRVIVSMNARELLEVFLPLRMCARAQWEIRAVAWKMRNELVKVHPQLFKFAGPRCVVAENRSRAAPCSLEEFLEGKCEFELPRCPELVPRAGIRACLSRASKPLHPL